MLSQLLERAARNLQDRFDILHVTSRSVHQDEWDVLPQSFRASVPPWLVDLLGTYRLVGGVMEYRDVREPRIRLLKFFEPVTLANMLGDGGLLLNLSTFGFFPFADESDGSVWVATTANDTGPIYLLDLPFWDGSMPSASNGLVFAASRIEYICASMGVSEASYYSSGRTPRFVMWYRE